MKIALKIIVFNLFILSFHVQAQNINVVIVDSKTKFHIDYVYITSSDKAIKLVSNTKGKAILIKDSKTKYFSFYKMGYKQKNVSIENLLRTDTIALDELPFYLDEIVVKPRILDTIVMNKKFYVNDYLALANGKFLILTYKMNLPEFEIAYYDFDKGITQSQKIKNEEGEFLFVDCFKNVHLITNKFSRQIFFSSDSTFDFLPKYNRTRFDSTLSRCALKLDTSVLVRSSLPPREIKMQFSSTYMNSPFLSYLQVVNNTTKHFYTAVYSKHIREMIKYEMVDGAMTSGITKEAGTRMQSAESMEAQHDLFFRKVAGPIYAPIFLKSDTVIIFNFQENIIVFLNKSGKILKEVAIDEEGYSSFRDFEVIYDNMKQKFYIKSKEFDKAVINRIEINHGTFGNKIKLEKIFAKNIQILNDRIYYLVTEKGWDDTCYLYRQNL